MFRVLLTGSPVRRPRRGGLSVLALVLALSSCAREDASDGDTAGRVERVGEDAAAATLAFGVESEPLDSVIFAETMSWARDQQLASRELGDIIAVIGRRFVGTPYTPGTLEAEGPERLIVNLRELDCVTYVESVLAMARVLRAGTPDYPSYQRELVRIRYRNGVLTGYSSRLHYFSEWIANNEEKGIVRDITASLGGEVDPQPLTFMTRNRGAYRQLADTAVFAEIRTLETTLSGRERHFIPQSSVAAAAAGIRDGDIIAATSTLEGLDIAHTGFALWVDGRLHLMHAPLVGRAVEISEVPLAERIQRIETQDGVMVARPI